MRGPRRCAAADPVGDGAALDNLIANALEHGRAGPRCVHPDGPRVGPAPPRRSRRRSGRRPESPARIPRRGHGLRIVREFGESRAGRFALSSRLAVDGAALELPIAEPELGLGRATR